ncbi:MAG TPA: RDD family protein [Pyrinomonadaceae bacterium]|nr:RDD family protein [Pyrinomonadaceae bacterium]
MPNRTGASSVYASFTRRALARLIDLGFVLAPCGLFYLVNRALGFPVRYTSLFNWQRPETATMFMTYDFPGFFAIFAGVKLFIAYPYFALMESSRWQATPGKAALGIKVTNINGARISFLRATGRYFLKAVSSLEFMLGYLISFSDQRQTWHDYMAQTLVVRSGLTFSPYYVMPKVSSLWMFELPLWSQRREELSDRLSDHACIWCSYRGEKHVECPACGRFGYAPARAVRAISLMAGLIFTLLGAALSYVTFWVVSERLADDQLGRAGTPWPVIFIIAFACGLCLTAGLTSVVGKPWLLRLMISLATGLGGRSFRATTSRRD